jgi:hypothetical protein
MMHLSRLTLFSTTPLLRSGGFLAMYNLMSAAAAAGVNRSTVLRAIKAKRISARNVTQRFNASSCKIDCQSHLRQGEARVRASRDISAAVAI